MRAIIIDEFGNPPTLKDVPEPTVTDDGAIIRVMANGICRSDWHCWMGHDPQVTLPHVPGHELAGVVETVGTNVESWKTGNRVTVPFSSGCGQCPECEAGLQNICDNHFQPGFTDWGSFAEFVHIRYAENNLVQLPDDMDFKEAATLGCRFATAFRGIIDQGQLQEDDWVAVHGCGGVGLSAILIASNMGAHVIAVDISDEKVELAKSFGATEGINAQATPDIAREIHKLCGGAHISIDAIGHPRISRNSVKSLRKRGRHVQIGLTVADERNVSVPMDKVIAYELEILGSHGIQAHRYADMLTWIHKKKIDLKKLVHRRVSLEESVDVLINMDSFSGKGVTVIDRF
ncbi:MAG: alcohol dehydrogenase [Candidatus Marinimicrobia bacterium]|nr:alcohol dehydrogenase [Candidatus Neomarinimicrobiota bacterium]|tara:strand:- start:1639 stop:2676 length:1038 start_codon:yes stop_codon:yes gene_type:complete